MKRIIFLVSFFSIILVGCGGNQSNREPDSELEISESANSTTTEGEKKTAESIESREDNYTLQIISEMAENSEDLDTILPDLYNTPNDYKILAEPSYPEKTYSFVVGPDNGEPVVYNEDEEDSEKYNLSNNPKAASISEVKQLIEELKKEQVQRN